MIQLKGKRNSALIFADKIEKQTKTQLADILRNDAYSHSKIRIMPDTHSGKYVPVGTTMTVSNRIAPSLVGVDIGCGMIAVETDIPAEKLEDMRFRRAIHSRIKELVPVGEGKMHKDPQAWDGFEEYIDTKGVDAQFITKLDRHNLGTLGGGNHFIEIDKGENGDLFIVVHSGSRHIGNEVAKYYQEEG